MTETILIELYDAKRAYAIFQDVDVSDGLELQVVDEISYDFPDEDYDNFMIMRIKDGGKRHIIHYRGSFFALRI